MKQNVEIILIVLHRNLKMLINLFQTSYSGHIILARLLPVPALTLTLALLRKNTLLAIEFKNYSYLIGV